MTRIPKPLTALVLALAVATCRDALAPHTVAGRIAVAPVFPSAATLAEFGLTIDGVRFVVVRPPADTLADTTVALAVDEDEIALELRVPLLANPETLSVSVVALSGAIPLFLGSRLVRVPTPLPPPEIALDTYVGPLVDSLVILPRDPFLPVNDSLRFQVQGFNGGAPVTQFYVAWSTNDPAVADVNPFGVLRAPGARGTVRVRARTPSGAADSVTATFVLPASQLVAIAGGGQSAIVGALLPTPLEVEARAADGLGVGGVEVRFRPLVGDGLVSDTLVVTDAAGRARTTATLGSLIGLHTFEAAVAGLAGSPATFDATALAGPVAQLVAVAGDAQLATVATTLPIAPSVRARDAGGNPVAGVSVSFTVASGGGSLTGGTQTTDANGVATAGGWTLGTLAGTNTITASAAGLTRTFSATGLADVATQLVRVAGDLQSAVVGTSVSIQPAVRVEDQHGNPISGASVTFAASGGGGGGIVAGASQLTNASGVATVGGWTLGTLVGPNTLTAGVSGVTPVAFSATGLAGAAMAIAKLAGDSQSAIVNTTVLTAPQVRVTDQYGNSVPGVAVSAAVDSGSGSVTFTSPVTDSAGTASVGSWRLGTRVGPNGLKLSASGLAGSPVGFTATALVDAPSQMVVFAGDGQSAIAGTAVDINPTVRVSDQFGNPVAGVSVTFTVVLGGGLIELPATVTSDTAGIATSGTWTLGSTAGLNTLEASGTGLPTVTFSAEGLTSLATTIALDGGDGQTGTVGATLGTPYAVRVFDALGLPVAGVPVGWAVTTGGGSITPAVDTTDGNGVAIAIHTLGPSAGTQTAAASVGGLSGSPVVFTATALADTPSQLVKLSADPQSTTVGTAVSAPPAVRVVDRFGNPVPGVGVTFAVTAGGGGVTGGADTTDAVGVAAVGSWILGTTAGQNSLSASVAGVTPVAFSATGLAAARVQLAFVVEPSRVLAGDTIQPAVQVALQDQYGNTDFTAKDVVQLDLGIRANPTAKLVGTTAVTAANGVAVFGDLAVDSAGLGYTLVATSGTLAGAESKPFDVTGVIAGVIGDRLDPVAAAFDRGTGFVFVPGLNNTLGVFDPGKLELIQYPILQSPPFGVAVNSATSRAYITTQALSVIVVDTRTSEFLGAIALAGEPKGVAVDEANDRVFVAVAGDPEKGAPPTLAVIDAKDARVGASIPFRDGALAGIGVAFNPNDGLVYVAIPNLGVGVFDPAKLEHVTTIPIVSEKGAAGTYGVAVDVRTNLVYATNRAEGTFSVVDPAGLKELGRLLVGDLPEGLGVDPDRGVAYVANSGANTLSLIETGKFTVFATMVVGPEPKAAAVDPATGRVYVPTFADDRVVVVQP